MKTECSDRPQRAGNVHGALGARHDSSDLDESFHLSGKQRDTDEANPQKQQVIPRVDLTERWKCLETKVVDSQS